MRILLLIDNLGGGGAQRQMINLSKLFKEEGFDVSFLVYGSDDFFEKDLENENIEISRLLVKSYLHRLLKVRKFIRKGKYDVVISFLDVPNFLNCFAAIGGKKWSVITNERSAKKELFYSKRGQLFAWFQRFSDAIVCNSYNAKNLWRDCYPKYEKKISVIYNKIDIPEIRDEYILRKDKKINILVAASYQYLKNPIGVIKALLLLTEDEREKIRVSWYGEKEVTKGDTRAYDEAIDLIQKNNLGEVIQLNEPTKDIINIMCQADFIGLFSRVEGLPNAICEGLLLGKPIIMSRVSDYSILVDESNGFLCDWDNPGTIKSAFVNAINLTDNDLLNMGKKSKEKAKKMFSPKIILNQWLKIIGND